MKHMVNYVSLHVVSILAVTTSTVTGSSTIAPVAGVSTGTLD